MSRNPLQVQTKISALFDKIQKMAKEAAKKKKDQEKSKDEQ